MCPYCGEHAELMDSARIYSKSFGMVWACLPCNAWVGVHKNDKNNRPLGTLADYVTRHARAMAHARFDPIWKARLSNGTPKNVSRGKAYAWLAGKLGIPVEECHIGLFDVRTCVRVVEICAQETPTIGPP